MLFVAYSLYADVEASGMKATTYLPYLLLFVALLIALGFEFVNGFHDTANAVATVIYTHTLPAPVRGGLVRVFNFLGVSLSTGAVAFGIISLLPVELFCRSERRRLRHGVRAAHRRDHLEPRDLVSRPAGLELAYADRIDHRRRRRQCDDARQDGTSGVDWTKATEIGYALLLSPIFGFVAAALLFLALKFVVRNPALYQAPKGDQPPPWSIRGILIAHLHRRLVRPWLQRRPEGHGPHHADPDRHGAHRLCAQPRDAGQPNGRVPDDLGTAARKSSQQKAAGYNVLGDPRPAVSQLRVATHDQRRHLSVAGGPHPAISRSRCQQYGSLAKVPAAAVGNTRNDMYLASEAFRFLMKDKENELSKDEVATLTAYKKSLDSATKFIPLWVKVAVAIALGLGTMVGWKRIVITVGEKIGKTHLTYAPGRLAPNSSPRGTIGAADMYGLPVSTTHVLSSGVAGTMAANGSGLQMVDGAQPADGLGADAARGDHAVGHPLRAVRQHILRFGGVATPLRPQQWFLVLRGRPTTDLRAFSVPESFQRPLRAECCLEASNRR